MLSRQSVVVGFLQAAQSALAAVNVIVTATVLGPEMYGQYVYLVTIFSIVPLLAGLGMEHLFLMEASRERDLTWTYFSHALLVRLGVSSALLGMIVLLSWQFAADLFVPLLMITAGLLLSAFPGTLFLALYRIEGRHLRPWLMALAGPLGFLIYITWARGSTLTLAQVARAFFLSHVFVLALFSVDMIRFARLEWDFDRLYRDIARSVVFSVSQAFDYAFSRIDIVLVRLLAGVHAVGIYAVGQRMVSLLQILPSSFHIVELPEFHRASAEPPRLTARFLALRRLLFELGLLFFGIIVINSTSIVRLLFGNDYGSTAGVATGLSVASLVMFVNYPYYMLAEAMRRLKERLVVRVMTFVATIILVAGGVWLADGIGAAVGMILGQVIFLVLLHRLTSLRNGGGRGMRDELTILVFAMGGGLCARVLYTWGPSDWRGMVLATLLYLIGWAWGVWKVKRSPTWALIADGLAIARRSLAGGSTAAK